MNIQSLQDASELEHFIEDTRHQEQSTTRHKTLLSDLELYPSGKLRIGATDEPMAITQGASLDLAKLVKIPDKYYSETCDADLRAYSCNYLIRRAAATSPETVAIEITENTIHKIKLAGLLPGPRLDILETIRNSIPSNVDISTVKVIVYHLNGSFDISVIAQTLTSEPQRGDTVAYGVNVAEDTKGSIQVQAAAFRLVCSNGALMRVCHHNEQRLRRPMEHTNRSADFLRRLTALARDAWRQWPQNAEDLGKMVAVPIYRERNPELIFALRNSPFFLSAGLAEQALERTEVEARRRNSEPTAWDLWNSLTFLGTHVSQIPHRLRYRLRIGAGELAHHSARTCAACHQVVLS